MTRISLQHLKKRIIDDGAQRLDGQLTRYLRHRHHERRFLINVIYVLLVQFSYVFFFLTKGYVGLGAGMQYVQSSALMPYSTMICCRDHMQILLPSLLILHDPSSTLLREESKEGRGFNYVITLPINITPRRSDQSSSPRPQHVYVHDILQLLDRFLRFLGAC